MSDRTYIYLLRHGQVHNPQGLFYGRLPRFRLSAQGNQQAGRAARFLEDKPIAAIYSSPLLRARQTAAHLLRAEGPFKIRISQLIDEVRSPFQGRPMAEANAAGAGLYSGLTSEFEQPADIVSRVRRFFFRTATHFRGRRVVAVTHGDVIVFSVLSAGGYPIDPAYKGRLQSVGIHHGYPAHGSVTVFTVGAQPDVSVSAMGYWGADPHHSLLWRYNPIKRFGELE